MDTVRLRGPAGTYEVPVHRAPVHTRVLQGAGLAAFLTVFRMVAYLRSAKDFSIAQLALLLGAVSLGGGVGGVAYYATDRWRVVGGWRKTVANVFSLLAYCFATIAVVGLVYWLTKGAVFGAAQGGA